MKKTRKDSNCLLLTVGLPRSGKSTWANQIGRGILRIAVVNPDSIRKAIYGKAFDPFYEPETWRIARIMVRALFMAGHKRVILDATSMTKKSRDSWKCQKNDLVKWDVGFIVFETGIKECIKRAKDGKRKDLIPVIKKMAESFEPLSPEERKKACFNPEVIV